MTTRTASIGDPFPAHAARRRRREWLMEGAIRACGWTAMVCVARDPFFVFREARRVPVWAQLGEFFTSANWRPDSTIRPQYGSLALLAGTLSVTALAMVLCRARWVWARRSTLGVLRTRTGSAEDRHRTAGGHSLGRLGLHRLHGPGARDHLGDRRADGRQPAERRRHPGADERADHRVGGRGRAEGRARLVSRGRAGAGASRWEIVYRVLFPAAKNGLLAAVLLGVGRAIGETMAVLMATGHAVQIPHSVLDPVRTLTATIAAELGETVAGGMHYRVLFVIGMLLLLITFVINVTADLVVKGVRARSKP